MVSAFQQNNGTPTVVINDVAIPIVANSLTYTLGTKTLTRQVATNGADSIVHVGGEDPTTQVAMINFEIFNTSECENLIRSWKNNGFNNSITITFKLSGTKENYRKCSLNNEPSFSTGPDGKLSLEFQGLPVT